MPFDADTRDAEDSEDRTRIDRRVLVPCLTIAFHPDPARIGDRALILRQASGRPVSLSRNELELADAAGLREARALEDPYLSRAPIELVASADGLSLTVPERGVVKLDGARISGTVRLNLEALAKGAVLELAKRVVLWISLAEIGPRPDDRGMIGESAAIRSVLRAIGRVADLDVPVLIRGETGVGKERVAQALHAASGREGPCIAVNVSTLPPTLAASELFGHAKGAFTGASERSVGLFERADRGMLFLDEIGELPGDVQPMLLRALESSVIQPIGEREDRPVHVRVVSATDADLEALVANGRFRAALYHRLRGVEITVPPLRDRREDVPRLLSMFLRDELAKTGELDRLSRADPDAPLWIDRKLVIRLLRHEWPGNVRQLQGVVRQLVVSSRGAPVLEADAAVERALAIGARAEAEEPRGEPSRDEILAALREHRWSFGKAARALGITRSALYRRTEGDPEIKNANDLSRADLERSLEEHGGDLERAAAALSISARALKLRMRAVGL